MADAALDTHKLIKKLTTEGQLNEAAAEALAEALMQRPADIATKHDLEQLRVDLRADFATKQDLEQLRSELRADISGLETRLAHTIRTSIVTSIVGSLVALTAIFGGFVAVLQIYA